MLLVLSRWLIFDRFINLITGVGSWMGMKGSFGLNQILGVFMYPFALLLGLPVAQQMSKNRYKRICSYG